MDEDSGMEQKTRQVYNFGKRNVFRLHLNESREGFFFLSLFLFCCCANLRGTAPTPLIPAPPTFSHTQGSFRIAAPPPEVHRRRRQIIGGLSSKGDITLLPSHFSGVQ